MRLSVQGILSVAALFVTTLSLAQIPVNLSQYIKNSAARASVENGTLNVTWPTGNNEEGRISINLDRKKPLFSAMQLGQRGAWKTVASDLNPAFVLTVGQRDLTKASGWNIFFDRTAYLPYEAYRVAVDKRDARVTTEGARTVITVSELTAGPFSGNLEITLYNGSPLLNVAAVMSTPKDSTAIIYDAGLVSASAAFNEIFWSDTEGYLQSARVENEEPSTNLAVKYRTIIGETEGGSVAVFPPPHQYFYPLDNAYNLKFTWYGNDYRGLIDEFGIGIRQELMGDRRHVPWFNVPPNTQQRLNFFCLLSADKDGQVMEEVKRFTNGDSYRPLPGY